ncbi:MAG: hypothetical protein U0166_12720 [Acidobacteriota bacterium]
MKQLRPILPVLIACALLGAYLLWSGARLVRERQLTPLEAQASAVLTEEGAALLVVIVLLVLLRGTFADLLLAPPERRRARPRTDLLVISFTALFVELMLIRPHCGSDPHLLLLHRHPRSVPSSGSASVALRGEEVPWCSGSFSWLVPFAAFMAAGSIVDGLLGQLAAIGSMPRTSRRLRRRERDAEGPPRGAARGGGVLPRDARRGDVALRPARRILGDAFDGVARHGYTINILGASLAFSRSWR